MFKITIITLGKFKEQAFKDLEKEYLKRLRVYTKLSIIEIPEIPYGKNMDMEVVKLQEAEKIIQRIPKDCVVVLLEEKGQLRNSKDFANFIERLGGLGKEITFIIGSGLGLHESLHQHSNYSISLSLLTFTHNFARVLIEEQLYRACTILNGKEYHK